MLAAAETAAPYSVTVYRLSRMDSERAGGWYDGALRAGGWSVRREGSTLRAERDGRVLVIRISAPKADGVVATVADLSGDREITN